MIFWVEQMSVRIVLYCLFVLVFAWFWLLPGYAADNGIEADNFIDADLQSWSMVTLTTPLSPNRKVQGYFEVQPRVSLLGEHRPGPVAVLLVRPAIGYQLTKNFSVWQGYAWVPTFHPQMTEESRIFQQLLLHNRIKKLSLTNRVRLEERFIQGAGGTSVRGRHMLRGSIPIADSEKWSWVAYNELFINLNSTPQGPLAGFDQNRTFVGINRKLNRHTNMEAGYMANYVNYRDVDRFNHIILLTLNLNLN
jgi:hypothetical protein